MTHARGQSQERSHQICICQLPAVLPSLFFFLASFMRSLPAIPAILSVAFPGYQHMSQRMEHHNLGPQALCFTQPHSVHIMHCHSSICFQPGERPLLKLAAHAMGAGHSSAPATRKHLLSPQREQYHNSTDTCLSLRDNILVFYFFLAWGLPS